MTPEICHGHYVKLSDWERLEAELAEAVAALKTLVDDCGDYESWERPCLAYDNAIAVLAKHSKT